MGSLFGELRYALRQFWSARIFTVTAILTLALGIGGTTAIFTLIHAVMLRSLPVGDPGRLYRIGDSSTCCVQGGPQDRWGMFSYPLFERLKAELPEFEEITAFQAGGSRLSIRRAQVDTAARPLRTPQNRPVRCSTEQTITRLCTNTCFATTASDALSFRTEVPSQRLVA